MASEHKVVSLNDTLDWPNPFQWPSGQREEVAARLEQLLDEMSRDGWELVSCGPIGSMSAMIFRREAKK